ncbi:MAG TPA: hypothetical protein PLB62_01420 [Candidatus Sumerlaeota bacterium]|nr:hypothetical protein [Candidatus Sumerlaeota bacterium]
MFSYMNKTRMCCIVLLCCTFFLPVSWAVDGQIDILPDGTTPCVISQPGSYVLVDNIMMTADVDCIQINANDVTLDMNGHSLTGLGFRSGSSVGIRSLQHRTRVFNGSVYFFGGNGIELKEEAMVTDVRSCGNGSNGIKIGNHGTVSRCIATMNTDRGNAAGILAGKYCVVKDCIANANTSTNAQAFEIWGIKTGDSCRIEGNTASMNSNLSTNMNVTGISAGENCSIIRNICNSNESIRGVVGIGSMTGGNILQNICSNNKSVEATVIGISTGSDSVIGNNTCESNYGKDAFGIYVMTGNVFGNVCSFNNATSGSCVGIGCVSAIVERNTCDSNRSYGDTSNATGILCGGKNCRVTNNSCSNNTSTGGDQATGKGTGIQLYDFRNWNDASLIESNSCMNNTSYGIHIQSGTGHQIVGNRLSGNRSRAIKVDTAGNYYAANIYQTAEGLDIAAGNTAGTVPGANTGY